jgi:hypothetical protein
MKNIRLERERERKKKNLKIYRFTESVNIQISNLYSQKKKKFQLEIAGFTNLENSWTTQSDEASL